MTVMLPHLVSSNRAEVEVAMATGDPAGRAVAPCGVLGGLRAIPADRHVAARGHARQACEVCHACRSHSSEVTQET